jgi:uncharacterized repeat protein (TIGR03806 family)
MRLLAAALLLLSAAVAAREPEMRVNDAVVAGEGMPAKLSDYGFFKDGARQVPVAGVTPYAVTTPLWSDGTEKLRFAYVPPGIKAKSQGEGLLAFPVGSALIKTFKMGGWLIETRVLLHRAEGWLALPYKWNAEQSEARLVLGGAREDLITPAGQAISYAIPNKNQCKECHALNGELMPIGPKARNLSAAWLAGFKKAGHLDTVPKVERRVPEWSQRAKVPVADAARGWLDANCAHCHNPGGLASNSGLYLNWEERDPARLGVMKRPVAAGRGSGDFEFDIVPGDPDHSILVHRLESLEGGVAMPELGRASRDPDGEAAVRAWITEMKR